MTWNITQMSRGNQSRGLGWQWWMKLWILLWVKCIKTEDLCVGSRRDVPGSVSRLPVSCTKLPHKQLPLENNKVGSWLTWKKWLGHQMVAKKNNDAQHELWPEEKSIFALKYFFYYNYFHFPTLPPMWKFPRLRYLPRLHTVNVPSCMTNTVQSVGPQPIQSCSDWRNHI